MGGSIVSDMYFLAHLVAALVFDILSGVPRKVIMPLSLSNISTAQYLNMIGALSLRSVKMIDKSPSPPVADISVDMVDILSSAQVGIPPTLM